MNPGAGALPGAVASQGRRWPPAIQPIRRAAVRVLRSPPPGPRLELQVLPEPFRLRAAHRDLRALRVLHPKDQVPAEPRDDLLDLVDVDQVRPVHAPEHLWIEACL